jgi:hypothetical protein
MSIMSSEYEIINDEDVLRRAATLFDEARVEIEPSAHYVTAGKDGVSGRTTFMEFNLPEVTIMPQTDEACDMRVVISNSFDGTKKERLWILLRQRRTGTNYLAFSQHETFAIRHRTGANTRLAAEFTQFIQNSLTNATECIRILQTSNAITTDAIGAYIESNRILSGDRNIERLMGRWMVNRVNGEPNRNLWVVYQVFAQTIHEDYGRNFSAKLGKMEQLNSDVRRLWHAQLGCPALPVI